ncbi:uncharacterized protein LOC135340665 [Halichondria panicea]|uniref:uncharacterized protein LOC135340665 n=1 Tax=Halichondria panicea TaxID=6063 RepID=UPI00312B4EBD
MSAFKAVACVVFLLVISASHSRSMTTTTQIPDMTSTMPALDLCSDADYKERVVRPTYIESSHFLSLLNTTETQIKQLDDLNVTRGVCRVLAAHETATRVGRNTMFQKKVRTDSILVQFFIGGPHNNSTEHFDPSFEASLDYLRKYCLYKFGNEYNALYNFMRVLEDLDGCPTTEETDA